MNTAIAPIPHDPLTINLTDDQLIGIASDTISQYTALMSQQTEPLAGACAADYASLLFPLQKLLQAAADRNYQRV